MNFQSECILRLKKLHNVSSKDLDLTILNNNYVINNSSLNKLKQASKLLGVSIDDLKHFAEYNKLDN